MEGAEAAFQESLVNAGKGENKAAVALARELAGFIWAIGQEERLATAN